MSLRIPANFPMTTRSTAKRAEIGFPLNKSVTPIPLDDVPADTQLEVLKWVLFVKKSAEDKSKKPHHHYLVSSSHISAPRHSVRRNEPTVMLSTLQLLASVIPTRMNS